MGPQFSLRTLLTLVTIAAAYCALLAYSPVLFAVVGVPVGLYCLYVWAKIKNIKTAPLGTTLGLVIGGFLLLFVVALLLPTVHPPRAPAPRHECLNNLHQIGLALASYHGAHGCYPPAFVADTQGKPLVSWRVLLLPYMEQRALYDQWKQHRDEPWDGPHNRKISQKVLEFLHCPSDEGPATDTSYVAVTGPGTIWPGTTQVGNAQITDGVANTLLLVEVKNSGINWMEPRDLDFTTLPATINPTTGLGISSNHPGVVIVQYADGRTDTLNVNISAAELRALLTTNGGDN